MSSPPVSKHTPLPTSVSFGARSSPQVRSMSRGARGCAADRVDRRIVLGEQRVADDDAAARARTPRHLLHRRRQLGRAHILGRRVDEIAREADPVGNRLDPRAVGRLRPDQPGEAAVARLVAGEGVGAERPAEREPRGGLRRAAPSSA